ncbi:hypothetical protein SDRG_07208 [Saprolegnia diclina VS20]|uniref:Uncharacterized protein n=1 Tax=Saprolegnia diclina (strain VS20) TaxID=1156394 RepID=T0QNU9_SAPDV|nr:hypothetical protein SDRG_07208 [Saprolegnia diclina VS20]EQC35500.1 hypothetical protein SDRG_07208 [Saprolegnia diclina VS20]|eukprot:XP_008611250.1 hypothetical protein SDRG_07208 [Saprolegnia diclina VS20]
MASPSETPLRVSPFFPRAPKACKAVAEPFFTCLHSHGKQPEGVSDPDAGTKAMAICAAQLQAYNQCVDQALTNKPKKLFRVPEAYRTLSTVRSSLASPRADRGVALWLPVPGEALGAMGSWAEDVQRVHILYVL